MSYPIFLLQDLGESVAQGLSVSRYRDSEGVSELLVNVKDLENLHIEKAVEQIKLSPTVDFQRYRLRKNDVVIAIRGTLLKSSVVTEASQGSIAGPNVAVFRPKDLEQVNPGYIAVIMRSKWMEQALYVLKNRSSTTLPSIRVSELRELKIPLPEISIQNKIVQLFLLSETYKKTTEEISKSRQELIEMSLFQLLEE
jgi:restriction endonuclease S subunit